MPDLDWEPELEPRAMYNLLRMNWQHDPKINVEPWQVEDYRSWSKDQLFDALAHFGIELDEPTFLQHVDTCETPEQLSEFFVGDEAEPEREDRVYLLIFELWRRLTPEKQSLSIFCDELDHRIHIYDSDPNTDAEGMQDALDNLLEVLEENADDGTDPQEVFTAVSAHCANDLEKFLYDFIADEIDAENDSYAMELVDGFSPFVEDERWFELLQVRLWARQDMDQAVDGLEEVIEDLKDDPDLDLYFEILDHMAHTGQIEQLHTVVASAIPLLEDKQDVNDLVQHCIDCCPDNEELKNLKITSPKDPQLKQLLHLCAS